jgi:hypothetical protein
MRLLASRCFPAKVSVESAHRMKRRTIDIRRETGGRLGEGTTLTNLGNALEVPARRPG